MFFALHLIFWALPGPRLSDPVPLQPEGGTIRGEVVQFRLERWDCRIRPLDHEAFMAHMTGQDVSREWLRQSGLEKRLQTMVVFLIELENRSEEPLIFNPDQVLLRARKGPVGTQVDMAGFWPSATAGNPAQMETFARIFQRGTVEVTSNRPHRQLVVFRPLGKKFPRRIQLNLQRLYHGILSTNIECQFQVEYPK